MRQKREPRQSVLSVKVTREMRRAVVLLSARFAERRGAHCTLTDVLEESIRLLCKREGVKVDDL